MHRLLLPLAATAAACAASAPPASAGTCGSPAVRSVVFEMPAVVVTKARTRRVSGGGTSADVVACVRATGRRRQVTADYRFPHEDGSGEVLGLFGRNLLIEESGGGAESEQTSRTMIDLATGMRTDAAVIGGTDLSGVAVASPAGLLHLAHGSSPRLVFRAPGEPEHELAGGAGLGAIALGRRTAYWRRADGTVGAAVVGGRPRSLRSPAPSRPPRGTRGRCERRDAGTLFRIPGVRVLTAPGGGVVCAARSGERKDLRRVVGEPAVGPVRDLEPVGPGLLAYRYAIAGDRTALVVLDVRTRAARHAGVVAGAPAEVASGPAGIVAAGPQGATLVTGTTVTPLTGEPSTDPAISASDDTGPAVAYWTTAAGPQAAP